MCFIRRFFNSILFAEKKAVFEDYRSRTGDFLMCLNISHFIKCQSQFALLLFIQLSAIQTRLSLRLSFFTEGIGKHRRLVFLPVVHNIIACISFFSSGYRKENGLSVQYHAKKVRGVDKSPLLWYNHPWVSISIRIRKEESP